jgi:hypothetical protein
MLANIHDHINQEIRLNTRTDTIFVVTAIVFNFVMLGTSSALAGAAAWDVGKGAITASFVIFIINVVVSILVNSVAIIGLLTGRGTRKTLMQGLMKMYQDTDVDQYYHLSLLTNYTRRYVMFIAIIGILGVSSVIIPLIVLLMA